MTEPTAISVIGALTKPATVLIEKISDAIQGVYEPTHIRRIAEAKSDADRIAAYGETEVIEIRRRAAQRWFAEEAMKQDNMESITQKALPNLKPEADASKIENDWIVNFFDKCRLISDDQMQQLWAALLAGEANAPGTHSKRTVNVLSSLDKSDALLFRTLCSFSVMMVQPAPVIYDYTNTIFNEHGLTFPSLEHLNTIGLISFAPTVGYKIASVQQKGVIKYFGTKIRCTFPLESGNEMQIGCVLLSQAGRELAPFCGARPIPGFVDYLLDMWTKWGYSPIRLDD